MDVLTTQSSLIATPLCVVTSSISQEMQASGRYHEWVLSIEDQSLERYAAAISIEEPNNANIMKIQWPKKTRVSNAKARTGCITCKFRRVKCDEAKPECSRCLNYSGKCGGYPSNFIRSKTRSLVPKLHDFAQLCRSPASVMFKTDQEYAYFQRFRTCTVSQLTGLRRSELWSKIVLQTTEAEPAVLHAAIAVGVLDFKAVDNKSTDADRIRQRFAFSEYHKAIVGLRRSLAEQTCDIRTKLVSCLLFACFEAYHGNDQTARLQLFAGIEMLEDYSKRRKQLASTSSHLLPPTVDEELASTFTLLEIQACSWGDPRSPELHLERFQSCREAVENPPTKFETIKQAAFYSSTNMLRGVHLRFSHQIPDFESNGNIPTFIGLGPCPPGPVADELDDVLAACQQYSEAGKFLYTKAVESNIPHVLLRAKFWRLQLLCSFLWNAVGAPNIESYYRKYTEHLEEVMSLSRALADAVSGEVFSFDMVVILPLMVVGWCYRHRAVRREVIRRLGGMKRKEMLWDATLVGKMLEWIAEIEEEGLTDEEYVPEDAVATMTGLLVDGDGKSALIKCRQRVRGTVLDTVLKETTIDWSGGRRTSHS